MIREATHMDIPEIVGMGEAFFSESGYADVISFDHQSTEATLNSLIDSPSGILLVIDDNGVQGMAGAVVYPFYFNAAEMTGQEMFYWVRPEFRGIGGALLTELEAKARALGAKTFSMIALDKLRPDAVGRLYEHRGYRRSDHSYIKRL